MDAKQQPKSLAVIFLHGNHKKADHWNMTEFGKSINIESIIGKRVKTFLIQIDDFTKHPLGALSGRLDEMKRYKCVVVCHSLGVLHCYELLKHLVVIGICFLDCTALPVYLEEIRATEDPVCDHLISYIQDMVWNIPSSIICHVHFNYEWSNAAYFDHQIAYYTPLTRKNDKSKIVVHPNKSHMIHYTDAPKIIHSILTLLNIK